MNGQRSYAEAIQMGEAALRSGRYRKAVNMYDSAEAFDGSKRDIVRKKRGRVFDKIEALRRQAVRDRKRVEVALKEMEKAKREALLEKDKALESERKAQEARDKAEAVLDKIYFYEGSFGLAYDKSKLSYGFIDKDLNVKIDFKYREALPFEDNGFAKVKRWKDSAFQYFLIDTLGNEYLLATELSQLNAQVTALDMREKSLKTIPPKVFQNPQLKILLLSYNPIDTLPAEIGELKNLTTLYLSSTKITSLSVKIGELKNLTLLNLSGAKITILPAEIGELKNLTRLNLSFTKITSLPAEIGE
jgi:hypothetical protein